MHRYSLVHVSDPVLLRDLAAHLARERGATADVLAHIAEVDARKLYLPAAYPSMYTYCVGALHLSEDAAAKRLQAARAARRFPAIFEAVEKGRLHLSAICLLAPHLTEHTAEELLAAANHKTKAEIERLLAERFPRTDLLAWVEATPTSSGTGSAPEHAPGHVQERPSPGDVEGSLTPALPQHAPGHAGDRCRVKPLAADSFAVQFTLSRSEHDLLRYAQTLLSHQVPGGDIAAVFVRGLQALVPQLERQKFAATARPRRRGRRGSENRRHIPDHVRRAVWERDQGRCTFVSEGGRRCEAREWLEFDHAHEVARGGEATVSNIRLRCRAHNQYGAECTFGAEFMRHKRLAAAEARAGARDRPTAKLREQTRVAMHVEEVVPWLRALGFNAGEARHAAALCEDMPHASLEERMRAALSFFRVRGTRVVRATSRDGGARCPLAPA